jgi:5'-nucleotidase
MKKIVYLDMDGVLVDLTSNIENFFTNYPHLKSRYEKNPDHIHGIFRDPKPIDSAIDSVFRLSEKYDLFIATSAPWGNPDSASDKRYWVERHFGNLFHKKMFVTHRKDLLIGDYLIDDRLKNGAKDFKGELIRFGWDYENKIWNEYPNWNKVLDKLLYLNYS